MTNKKPLFVRVYKRAHLADPYLIRIPTATQRTQTNIVIIPKLRPSTTLRFAYIGSPNHALSSLRFESAFFTMAAQRNNTSLNLNGRGSGQRQKQGETSGSVLDQILERTINIDESRIKRDSSASISNAIRDIAKMERSLRESTITLKITENFDHATLVELIHQEWTIKRDQMPVTYWRDREYTFCQFVSPTVKNSFLDLASLDENYTLKHIINRPNKDGQHFKRKPVRIEIQGVKSQIQADKVLRSIRISVENKHADCLISEIREGKLNAATRCRSLMLNVDADGFRHLFGTLGGVVPYVCLSSSIRARLTLRVNCRPWVCKSCFSIGRHDCQGPLCAQCGRKDHSSRDCGSKTTFCSRCNKSGHKATSLDCPIYLFNLTKELRRVDIPLEYYEEKDLRTTLIKALILK